MILRALRLSLVTLLLYLLGAGGAPICAQEAPAAAAASFSSSGGQLAVDATQGLPALPFPGGERAALELPPEIWEPVTRLLGAGDHAIGYTPDEMGNYGRSTLLLSSVLRLFGDVRVLPRFSETTSQGLLDNAAKVGAYGYGWSEGGLANIAQRCYGLLDTSTGRRTMPIDTTAGVDELPVRLIWKGRDLEHWRALPGRVRTLIARLYTAAEEVGPWVRVAFDADLLCRLAGASDLRDVAVADLYGHAMAHRNDEHLGQLASLNRDNQRILAMTDLAYLGYATVLWLRHLERALQEYRQSDSTAAWSEAEENGKTAAATTLSAAGPATFRLPTPLGQILVGGRGDDDHREPAFIAVELGGNDAYGAGFGAPRSLGSPVAVVLDLAGADRYLDPAARAEEETRTPAPSFGAGVFGIGVLCDLDGNDEYEVHESGLGRGCCGSGILVDFAGDDRYYGGGRWTQGAAHCGIGALIDLAGDDHCSCAQQSQGLGATLGAGLLLDLSGTDQYVARDDGNISELYLGQSVAMSQGCGYGRRADLGDGHSLAGGFGLLIDGAGDDTYHAQVWSQGCGYWWGVGVLEDRAGNDRYRNGKYSSGAAAHFAIGIHVDLSGEDTYNVDNDTAKNQYQGHARDGSVGVFIDGDGDDRYELRTHCAGSGDLGSIGLFWDRRGDDRYRYVAETLGEGPWALTPPLGSTTHYDRFGSFRDDLPVYGIFLDTAGHDLYELEPSAGADAAEQWEQTAARWGDDRQWTMRRNANAWGLGFDASCYGDADDPSDHGEQR